MRYKLNRDVILKTCENLRSSVTEEYYDNGTKFYFDRWYEGMEHPNKNISIFHETEHYPITPMLKRRATFKPECYISEKDLHNEQFSEEMDKLLKVIIR